MSGSRLRVAHARSRAARARTGPVGHGQGRGRGVHAGRTAGARARARDGGGRVLPHRPRPGLRGRRGRAVPRGHERGPVVGAASRRDPRRRRTCRSATPGISSCFRREAGTYGKDTRGIFRVHQFDKVEMFAYVDPDRSWEELDAILAVEESIVQGLGLPYRVMAIAAGDLGAAGGQEVRHRGVAPVRGPLPRAHVLLELHRLLRPPSRARGCAARAATASCTR